MIRPARASTARTLTRSPEPRRPLLWSIERKVAVFAPGAALEFYEWTCLVCASGAGQAPSHRQADNDAHVHWRANHNHQETRA